MTASAEVRAQRRFLEMQAKGQTADFDEILKNVRDATILILPAV